MLLLWATLQVFQVIIISWQCDGVWKVLVVFFCVSLSLYIHTQKYIV